MDLELRMPKRDQRLVDSKKLAERLARMHALVHLRAVSVPAPAGKPGDPANPAPVAGTAKTGVRKVVRAVGVAGKTGVGSAGWARRKVAPAAEPTVGGVPAKPSGDVPAKAAAPEKKPTMAGFYSKRYRLRGEIPGGHALVCRAWDRELEMEVVLKFLPQALVKHRETVADLKREAAVAMQLTHENIVRLYNVDLRNPKPFIVMEYIKGETLRRILQRVGAVSVGSMIGVAAASVSALAYAHERGVLHRDIKLENIMVTAEGVLKILDFGSAMRIETVSGKYIEGTPGYMAPEQVAGGMLDGRADVFGLGTVLWELVVGRPAFPDRQDLLHMYDKTPESGDIIEPGVEAVLRKALAVDPAARWGSVVEFGDMLKRAVGKVL